MAESITRNNPRNERDLDELLIDAEADDEQVQQQPVVLRRPWLLLLGLVLVALNLQTAFLSPPVAMAAFYLKGVSPPGVTLNQIFLGMIPFMFIQIFAMFVLYVFPQIGMWLPSVLYR